MHHSRRDVPAGSDLIVMGSHSCGVLAEQIVGGVSKVVLRKAPCQVLII